MVFFERVLYDECPFAHGNTSQRDRRNDIPRVLRWLECAALTGSLAAVPSGAPAVTRERRRRQPSAAARLAPRDMAGDGKRLAAPG